MKQALDIGLMGVIFNGVDSTEQALPAVRTMRYPPLRARRAGARRHPRLSTAPASYAWGVSAAEYERHADVWPLNPEGDLLAVVMIESVEGLELDQIAAVPGVGALFLGAGSDLSRSLGVRPAHRNSRPRSAGAESVQGAQSRVRHHRRHATTSAPGEGRLEDHSVDGARDHAGRPLLGDR